nr:hypothetical protein [Tanacetum cinerariifolium]
MLKQRKEKRIEREQMVNLAVQEKQEEQAAQRLYLENSSKAITPVLPTEEHEYSLSTGDKHLSTILETESKELIKYGVENLIPIPSEYKVTSDNKSECDVPVNDESSLILTTFSNPLFDCNNDFTSSDDESLSNEDDGDSHMEEIDLFLATDELMPPGIENDDYDSEGDVYFLEEMFSNDPIPLPENESFNFDHYDEPSFPRTPPEPPDVEVFVDSEPDSGELISTVMNNIDELNEDDCFDPGGNVNHARRFLNCRNLNHSKQKFLFVEHLKAQDKLERVQVEHDGLVSKSEQSRKSCRTLAALDFLDMVGFGLTSTVLACVEPPLLLEALLLAGLPLFLGIKRHLPLFVPVEADDIVVEPALVFKPSVACDGVVFEPDGVGGSGIVLEPDGGGIVFKVDGDGVGGGDIV